MATLEEALALAAQGFHIFPVVANSKLPLVKDWPELATRDVDQIASWFHGNNHNIGIATSRFGDDKALLVVDVDVTKGKDGNAAIFDLEMQGNELPVTLEQATPSGGRHIIYVADAPCKQGVNVLGAGLDIRSRGGFIVGPGSAIDGKKYQQINGHGHLAPAPGWLVERLGVDRGRVAAGHVTLGGVDPARAAARAIEYLKTAPVSVEGEGGDITAFKVACKLKDIGCAETQALFAMVQHWNDRCDPPWDRQELREKVHHAYRYGKEPQGSLAAEAVFPPPAEDDEQDDGGHPFDTLNKGYAYVVQGDHVIWETTDAEGHPFVAHLNTENFHKALAAKRIQIGEKTVPLTKAWMNDARRRTFDGFAFAPQQQVSARWYNLWRGFTVEPKAGGHPSVEAFKEHALKNVCNDNADLCHWLMGYFAHMIQRPYEKPLVALVFKGKKGTGKNALIERVGHLLGRHFMVTSKRRHMVGQFNGHLESCLCLTLDEAFWSGDKESEGVLKDLITGHKHTIEHKGKESFEVRNLTRVVILGNEEWIVPVTDDERRFAVFTVGNGRRQDRKFFEDMRVGMQQGGYAHLLHFLQTYDLTGIDINGAPKTQGLLDQMHASMNPLDEWWFDCISDNRLVGDSFEGALPDRIPKDRMHAAFLTWAKGRNIKQRLPKHRDFVNTMNTRLGKHKRTRDGERIIDAYHSPGIDALRAEWEKFIGGAVDWTN